MVKLEKSVCLCFGAKIEIYIKYTYMSVRTLGVLLDSKRIERFPAACPVYIFLCPPIVQITHSVQRKTSVRLCVFSKETKPFRKRTKPASINTARRLLCVVCFSSKTPLRTPTYFGEKSPIPYVKRFEIDGVPRDKRYFVRRHTISVKFVKYWSMSPANRPLNRTCYRSVAENDGHPYRDAVIS